MKYIRTKDGIYEVVREILNGKAYEVKLPQSEWWYDEDNKCYYEDSKFSSFHKRDVIKQANTIEELIDGYVIVNPELEQPFYTKAENWGYRPCDMENYAQYCLEHSVKVYGAIWTDKGLIYVAKMNEKGELELC